MRLPGDLNVKCLLPALLILMLAVSAQAEQDRAQPPLPTVILRIGGQTLKVEVAADDTTRAAGLMYRESLEENAGMLFVMPATAPAGFWMRNTKIPLSIAYISPTGVILEIHNLEPLNETPVRSRFPNIAYALEVRRDWFSDHGVFPGARIEGIPPAVTAR